MLNFVAVFAAVCRARFLKHNPPATIRYGHKRTRHKSEHQMSAWVRNANFLKCQQSYRSRRLSVFLHWFVIIADLWRANNKLEKTFLQPATAFENELEGPFADPAGWYMRCNKTIFPFSLVVHSWAHSQRASFAKLCCVRRDGIIVLAYTTPVDSQQKMVPIFLRNEEKLARETQKHAGSWIADTIPSLSSQSEHAKNTIHWFGIYKRVPNQNDGIKPVNNGKVHG